MERYVIHRLLLKSRHNATVYRYMLNIPLSNKAVAVKLGVSMHTVYNYINRTIEELAILCFGIPVSDGAVGTWQEGIKSLLENYQLLKMSMEIHSVMKWDKWQQEREKYKEITKLALEGFGQANTLYEEFVKGSSHPDRQRIALDVIKMLYIEDCKSISEFANMWNISESAVYTDIRKVTERLGELAAYLTDKGGYSSVYFEK